LDSPAAAAGEENAPGTPGTQHGLPLLLQRLLASLPGNGAASEEALRGLGKITSNLAQHPTEPKYQRVNLASSAVARRFPDRAALEAVLAAAGFTRRDDDDGDHLSYTQPTPAPLGQLTAALAQLLPSERAP
jgi:hypothetical protein